MVSNMPAPNSTCTAGALYGTGEAFKEAHGGGTIFGFAEMLISSLMVLKGGPKPAFYEGLLPVVKPPPEGTPWKAVGGWRDVPADGKEGGELGPTVEDSQGVRPLRTN